MSPTSSDPTSSDPRSGSFRRLVTIVIVALVVLCGALFAVAAVQGPRLSSVVEDLGAATPQLRLTANQGVAPIDPDQVVIEPAVAFTVDTSASLITVSFPQGLAYATDYRLTIDGVHNPIRDTTAAFGHEFSTGSASVLYLDRAEPGSGEADRVYSAGVGGGERSVVYSAERILEIARVGGLLAVSTATGEGTSDLHLVDLDSGAEETVILPGDGLVSQLRSSASGQTLGFAFTEAGESLDKRYLRSLFTIDLTRGRDLVEATALDGSPVHVLDWQFQPRGEGFLSLGVDRSLLRFDASGAPPTPLGEALTLGRITSDGSSVTLSDAFGFIELDLTTLEEQRLELSPVAGAAPFPSEIARLSDGRLLAHAVLYDEASGAFDDLILLDDGSAATELVGIGGDTSEVRSFTVTSNGQYAVLQVTPNVAAGRSDGYPVAPTPTTVTTVLVDLSTGGVVASFDGMNLLWG